MQDPFSIASLATAFGAGVLSVLSPCVMPLMPAYLSLISGISVDEMREEARVGLRRRVLLGCAGFVAGFSAVFVLLGATATAAGRVLRTWHVDVFGLEVGATHLAGVVIVLMGLHLLGWLPIPLLLRESRFHAARPRGFLGTFLVGAAFAFGWTPCVGPILGAILTLAGGRETVGEGMALLAVYSLGLGVPFFMAGWSIEIFFRGFAHVRQYFRVIERVSGALLVGIGLLVLTQQLTVLNAYFSFLSDWVVRAEEALL